MIGTHSEGDTLLRTMSEGRMDVKKDMRKTENDVTGLGDEGGLQAVEGRAGHHDEW